MKESVFNVELNRIQDQNVRASTELLLNMLPDYFFEIPASSSGKYHPIFYYQGKSFATLSLSEKNKISHRGLAFKDFYDFIIKKYKK